MCIRDRSFGDRSGGRAIRRTIRREVEDRIAELLVESAGNSPAMLKITAEGDKIRLLHENLCALMPKHILIDDIVASISYLLNLPYGVGVTDDIDHLGNRRLRSVGELLQNQIRIGLARLERVVRERMSVQNQSEVKPQELINIRPVSAAIKMCIRDRCGTPALCML